MEDNKKLRERSKPKKMRVCFPDGTIFCYASVKETFVQTLVKIGTEKLQNIKMEIGHLPIFSKEIYPKFKDWMVPIGNGWYVNTQSDTDQKYRQLYIICQQLGLDVVIDVSADFKGEKVYRGRKNIAVLEVSFDDGTIIAESNTADTFIQCIWKIGINNIQKKNVTYDNKQLITNSKLYNGQVQVDSDKWLVIPSSTKNKAKILKVVGIMMNIKMDIFYL